MAYQLGNGIWNGVFAVPNCICDQHIKLASGVSVKVLLLLLRHGGTLDAAEMGRLLGYSEADILDAVNYWILQGVLAPADPAPAALSYQEIPGRDSPAPETRPAAGAREAPGPDPGRPRKVVTLSSSRPRLTTGEINELASQDKNLSCLLQEAQAVLGKPLTPVASSTIAALYSYNGMRPDLILMLAHYCVSIGKGSMRYIERMADDWVDKGIDSHEKAEAEILRLTQRNQMENRIKSAFGIHDRSLVTSERNYIRTWVEEYKLDLRLIELAYERSVELKGKLSFPYINGILSNWYGKGIKTPAQAAREIRSRGPADTAAGRGADSSYDIGELEKLISSGDL